MFTALILGFIVCSVLGSIVFADLAVKRSKLKDERTVCIPELGLTLTRMK